MKYDFGEDYETRKARTSKIVFETRTRNEFQTILEKARDSTYALGIAIFQFAN